MANIGERLPQPEEGWRRYDDRYELLNFSSAWVRRTNLNGTYNSTDTYSNLTAGNTLDFLFVGTKIRLLGIHSNDLANNIKITVDGTDHFFSQYSSTAIYSALSFELNGLENKIHTVRLHSAAGAFVSVDAIDIDEDGGIIRQDYESNDGIPEHIRKYGIAWYRFDEETGNTFDNLGNNIIGTLKANIQRVEGWNKKGKAVTFNGSGVNNDQLVVFNSKTLIPIGEKSIRFKMKTSQSQVRSRILSSDSGSGHSIQLNEDGTVNFAIVQNNSIILLLNSTTKVNDGRWHDILITWDGTNNVGKIKLYIDDMTIPNVTGTATNNETIIPNTEVLLGRYAPSYGYYFKGEIDDFQVFAKALSPSDLENKKVSIKTLDDKYLILSNKNGRVKEIISATDDDIVKESYKWNDIENASDRENIELTRSTTEYEILSKDNTTLGNGKLFTLSVSNFKTIKVENNY